MNELLKMTLWKWILRERSTGKKEIGTLDWTGIKKLFQENNAGPNLWGGLYDKTLRKTCVDNHF